MHIQGNRQGRGEGRQEKHSFSKMQTAKRRRRAAGNYKMQKKLSIDARGGYIMRDFFLQKIKNSENTAARQGPVCTPIIIGSRSQHLLSVVVKQAVIFLFHGLDYVVGVFVVGRRDA